MSIRSAAPSPGAALFVSVHDAFPQAARCGWMFRWLSRQARASSPATMVNLPTAGVDYHVPFGGSKKSSYGAREQGFAAAEFYTQIKTSYSAG